jgi:glutathione S-transferase
MNRRETETRLLTLYYGPDTCARAVHIALEDAGAEYEARRVDFSRAENRSPGYLAINPKGRVPALATPRGVLTEVLALLLYIAQTHPEKRLAPLDDPFELARMLGFAGYLASTVHVAHAHRTRGPRWADEPSSLDDMKRKSPANMRDCFRLIESKLFGGPWAMGEAYSVIDPYLFTLSGWLGGHGVELGEFPVIADHFGRMSARDSVKRVIAAEAG